MARVDNRKAASHYYQSGDDNSETASEGVSQAEMGKPVGRRRSGANPHSIRFNWSGSKGIKGS